MRGRMVVGLVGLGMALGSCAWSQSAAAAGGQAVSAPAFNTFKEAYAAGNQALKDRRFTAAAADYGAAEGLVASPKSKSEAANAQGWAYLKAKDWADAKDSLARAVSEDGGNKTALKNLGACSYSLYEYGLAGVEELKAAIDHLAASGDSPELLDRAKADLAREDSYAQATPGPEPKLAGQSFKALLSIGDQAQAQGRFDLALKAFKAAETLSSTSAGKGVAANRAGKALLDARRIRDSVAYFERAVADQPKEKVYLNNLGYSYWVLYDSGKGTLADLKKAVDVFYRANAIDPSYHSENMTMALDDLKDADPSAAAAYDKGDENANPPQTTDSPDSR
ncbi:MAG TPA: tetratricopeptide repeat protein [bacterium]|nr:tetratricopeptide repeat protein [bacterium]